MSNEKDLETINGKPLHPGVKELCAQFGDGKMDRREFVRLAAFLGVSAASSYAFAGDQLGGALVQKARSEEHTAELQSLMRTSYAFLCLKKQDIKYMNAVIYWPPLDLQMSSLIHRPI